MNKIKTSSKIIWKKQNDTLKCIKKVSLTSKSLGDSK
jgi:hypothetical protein